VSFYIEQIRLLTALQRVDDGIHIAQQDLEAAPKEVEELKKSFAALDAHRSNVQDKIRHLQDQQRRLNYEIKDEEARLENSRAKLMQVENDQEYQAVTREIDIMKRQNMIREEEMVALSEEESRQKEILAEQEGPWNDARVKMEAAEKGLEQKIESFHAALASLEEERKKVGGTVEPHILKRYEFIRDRLRHPVIVPVDDCVCSGCHMMLPPQTYIELQKGSSILSCPSCQRLIYWRPDFQDLQGDAQPEQEEK